MTCQSCVCRVATVPGKGRGVVANRAIARGEVVERSPVIVVPPEQCESLEKTILDVYVFLWGADKESLAVALGVGSLFNHSYSPNVVYTRELESGTILFTALADIAAGTELTVNYNGRPDSLEPVWFDPA